MPTTLKTKNLFDAGAADHMKQRIDRLTPTSERQWGTMTAPQALAHCSTALEWAVGERAPDRMPVARIFGRLIKPLVFKNDAPMKRNSPTAKSLLIADARELTTEQQRLRGMIDRFVSGGPARCTTQPHSFFGPLTPHEWATLMYKHLDHHLRQFGV
jgi:uncharacterized protein DUF1569